VRPSPPIRLATALLAVALGVAGCATTPEGAQTGDVTRQADDAVVELVGLEFAPKQIQVPTGTRVLWQWTDSVVHNVVSDTFKSSAALNGGAYAIRFDRPGTYPYRCTLHTGMDGTVVVTP
jgi:plastocyanin